VRCLYRSVFVFALLFVSHTALSQANVTVIAGATWAFSGNGGPAASAPLGAPGGFARDTAGNLYFSDYQNNMVFQVTPAGVITIVAGNGTASFSGDGGPATAAALSSPQGVAVDSKGNIFIADTGNHRIREVTAGVINTIAGGTGTGGDGGPAINAQLSSPVSLAFDPSGNLYVADSGSTSIRMITPVGIISTFVGFTNPGSIPFGAGPTVQASLAYPQGVAVDTAGNLYIADTSHDRILKVTPAGVVTTVAGSSLLANGQGVSGFSGDGGPATAALLNEPYGVAVDTAGNLYIADSLNQRIRKVTPAGVISTIAGTSAQGFSGDGGSATSAALGFPANVIADSAGNIYIADWYSRRIRLVGTSGTINTFAGNGNFKFGGDGGPATSAFLNTPRGLATDSVGNLYVADGGAHIRKVTPVGIISTIAGTGTYGYGGDGGPATSALIGTPYGVAVDSNQNVFLTDGNNIRKIAASGVISTFAGGGSTIACSGGQALGVFFQQPESLAVDSQGNLLVADTSSNCIERITPSGVVTRAAGGGSQVPPVGDNGTGALSAALQLPEGVAADAFGDFFIADTRDSRIRMVGPTGAITSIAGYGPLTLPLLGYPCCVAVGPAGAVVFGGALPTLAIFPGFTVTIPLNGIEIGVDYTGAMGGLAFDPAGNLYVSDTLSNRVIKVTFGPSPVINVGGAVNGASFMPGIAPGMIVSLFGQNLAPATASASGFPLPTTLNGVSVLINGLSASLLFVSPTQVNFQVPLGLTGTSLYPLDFGTQFIITVVNGLAAPLQSFTSAAASPGIFTINSAQQGAIQISNTALFAAPAGSIPGSQSRPALPGESVTIYCTGLGNVSNPPNQGVAAGSSPLSSTPTPATVTIGGQPATVTFSGLAPGFAGLYQVNATVPASAPAGNAVPLTVSIGGATSNTVTLAVQ
jgi:uncharacterized protein (TIGR03437 family)